MKDKLALAYESAPEGGKSLLVPLMKGGELVRELPELEEIRSSCVENVSALPADYRSLEKKDLNPVEISEKLESLWNELVEKHKQ